jgi:hypothetical protein
MIVVVVLVVAIVVDFKVVVLGVVVTDMVVVDSVGMYSSGIAIITTRTRMHIKARINQFLLEMCLVLMI